VQPHDLPATEDHPRGRRVPVVRRVYRQGERVS
jgi:alpha-D-ribose 1-methylphosphonate 5-triphosphate diphosphatase